MIHIQHSSRAIKIIVTTGIALSVATLLVILSVLNGFEQEYKKGLLDFNAHIIIPPQEGVPLSPEQIKKWIPEQELKNVSAFLYREALLIHQGKIRGVVLKGVPVVEESTIKMGEGLAEKLGATDQVKMFIPKSGALTEKDTLMVKIAGTFRTGLYEFDSQFAIVSLKTLQQWFALPENYFGLEVRLQNPESAPRVAKQLEEKLGPFVVVQHWMDLNRPLFEAIQLEKWAFRILLGLMIFVASLNLIGAVLLAIFRKKKMIAILQSLGLSPPKIVALFSYFGFRLGMLGVGLGLFLGLCVIGILGAVVPIVIDPQVYFLETLPLKPEARIFFIIAGSGLLLVWIIAFIAARQILKIPIREGLHGPG